MTTSSAHTPGPWSVERPSKGFDGYIIHGGPTGAELATLVPNGETNPAADARLIAAAPTMKIELLGGIDAVNRLTEALWSGANIDHAIRLLTDWRDGALATLRTATEDPPVTDMTRYLIARPASDHTEYLRTFVREGRVIVADWIDTKPYAYGFRTLEEATELARALGGECSVLASERGRWVRVFP